MMVFRATGSADAFRFFLELHIMIEMNDVNHLMLQRVVDIIRKQLMILFRKDYLLSTPNIDSGSQKPVGIADAGHWQLAGKVSYIIEPKAFVKLFYGRQLAVRLRYCRHNRLFQRWREQIIIGLCHCCLSFFSGHGEPT